MCSSICYDCSLEDEPGNGLSARHRLRGAFLSLFTFLSHKCSQTTLTNQTNDCWIDYAHGDRTRASVPVLS